MEVGSEQSTTSQPGGVFLEGQVFDLAADLRTFRPGSKLDIPYELTVSESMQDFWQSVRWLGLGLGLGMAWHGMAWLG
jgi:hypothetical protein